MRVFQFKYAFGEGFGGVGGFDRTTSLQNVIAVIIVFVDPVDGDARFFLASCQHGSVDVDTVHALSPELGQ